MVFRYLQRLIQSFSEVDWSVWSISVRSDTAGEAGSDAWDVRDAPEVRDVRDPDVRTGPEIRGWLQGFVVCLYRMVPPSYKLVYKPH